nr:MAG TPA: transcriptional repressor DicA [Caudoviricetes sp.]
MPQRLSRLGAARGGESHLLRGAGQEQRVQGVQGARDAQSIQAHSTGREGRTEMNRLKERRLELGLTQEAVSGVLKLVDPRIDTCMVSRFENGVCLPTEEVLTALEAALRTSRAYLYGDEDKADIPQRTAETERIAALIPHGRRNAISRAELAAAMQTSDRMMRKAVSEAKRQGVMICNDGEGYYQTEELGDLYRQYKRDTARAMSILKARKPMRDVLKAAGRPV